METPAKNLHHMQLVSKRRCSMSRRLNAKQVAKNERQNKSMKHDQNKQNKKGWLFAGVLIRPVWRGWTHRLESQQWRWLHGHQGAHRSVTRCLNLIAPTERVDIRNFSSYHNAQSYKSWALVSVSLLALRLLQHGVALFETRGNWDWLFCWLRFWATDRTKVLSKSLQDPTTIFPFTTHGEPETETKTGEKRQKRNNVKSTNIKQVLITWTVPYLHKSEHVINASRFLAWLDRMV